MIIISKPAASHNKIQSFVLFATPPKSPLFELGLIKTFLLADSSFILLLSPKILPCDFSLDGSIAKIATFLF